MTKRLCAMCWGKLRDAGVEVRQSTASWEKAICDGCGERRYTATFDTAEKKRRAAQKEA